MCVCVCVCVLCVCVCGYMYDRSCYGASLSGATYLELTGLGLCFCGAGAAAVDMTHPTWLSTGGFWLYFVFCLCGSYRREAAQLKYTRNGDWEPDIMASAIARVAFTTSARSSIITVNS